MLKTYRFKIVKLVFMSLKIGLSNSILFGYVLKEHVTICYTN